MKKDYEMPPAPEASGSEEEEFDFDFEGSDEEKSEGSSDLASFSDEELIEEMKSRGYEYDEDESPEGDEEPSEDEESDEEVDMSMFEA